MFDKTTDVVLVTGASGFLATHIVKQLLEGGYHVKGTVRNVKDEKKVAPLRKLVENPKFPLEFCQAELLDEKSWIEAVEGCKIVIHTASPIPSTVPMDENECIVPAVNGTLNVFKACVSEKSIVEKVILTSSVAAIAGDGYVHGKTYTEKDWGDPTISTAYIKSKILAEKAAWDFLKDRAKNNQKCFELAVINPGFIAGPILHDTFCASMEPIKRILEKQMPLLPDLYFPLCDVRDVALAHINAITVPDAVNNRHIICSSLDCSSIKDYALILEAEFGPKGYNIPTRVAPNIFIRIYAIFDRSARFITPLIGKICKFDNQRMQNVLGVKPTDVKTSIIDMASSMIERGFVTKPK